MELLLDILIWENQTGFCQDSPDIWEKILLRSCSKLPATEAPGVVSLQSKKLSSFLGAEIKIIRSSQT